MFDEITIIWNTDELKRYKPSPFDEARWGLAIIEDSLWDTIPKVYRRLNEIFVKNMNRNLPKILIQLNLVHGWVEIEMEIHLLHQKLQKKFYSYLDGKLQNFMKNL